MQDAPRQNGFVGFGRIAEITLRGANVRGIDERKFAARGDAESAVGQFVAFFGGQAVGVLGKGGHGRGV